jgi:hypothetical protein
MWFTLAAVVLIAKVDLGRHLFYDARMSINGAQSCASCHQQNLAFTDGKPQAIGSTGQQHPRSAMSLVNLTRAKLLTWTNPHEQTLEEQALTPMFGDHPVELGVNADAYVALIRNDATYRVLFTAAALPCSISAVTQAIAAFERTIISNRSPYDRYHSGTDDHAISDSAKRGETLFFSEPLSCFRCHGGPNFSDSAELKDNGLLPEGGRFKAPTLRNIAVTAPICTMVACLRSMPCSSTTHPAASTRPRKTNSSEASHLLSRIAPTYLPSCNPSPTNNSYATRAIRTPGPPAPFARPLDNPPRVQPAKPGCKSNAPVPESWPIALPEYLHPGPSPSPAK